MINGLIKNLAFAAAGCLCTATAADAFEVNLLCVGNSITEGATLERPHQDAPPMKCARLLAAENGIDNVNLLNGGCSGSTTVDWLPSTANLYQKFTAKADTLVANHPEAMTVVSISLGTNDTAETRCTGAPLDNESYRSNLRTITDSLLARYPGAIAVLHTPLWYSDNVYNGARYLASGQRRLLNFRQEVLALVAEYAEKEPGRVFAGDTEGYGYFRDHHLTDMTPEQGQAGVFYLHPNNRGGDALARLWERKIAEAINSCHPTGTGGTYGNLLCYTEHGPCLPVREITVNGENDPYFLIDQHGPTFESDLTAWRVYFNEMQTVDIYSKRKKGLELATTQFHPTDSMLNAGYGDDCLMVRSTCGAGTLRGWTDGKITPVSPVRTRTARLVCSGPLMTVAEIEVTGWNYHGKLLDATFRYTILAGHRDVRVDVSFNRPLATDESFALGIQKMPGDMQYISPETGIAASWGADYPQPDTTRHAPERVALGLKIDPSFIRSVPDDPENLLFEIGAPGSTSIHYNITFTSEKETFGYRNFADWLRYLESL